MKKVLTMFLYAIMMLTVLTGCSAGKTENSSVNSEDQEEGGDSAAKVVLNEVAHSIFYAPMYVAIEKDYFTQEGIDLELVTGFGVHQLVQDTL